MQKYARQPVGSSTSTTRITPPAGRHVATNVLYFLTTSCRRTTRRCLRTSPAAGRPRLANSITSVAIGRGRATPPRPLRPGHRSSRAAVLAEPADDGHPHRLGRLEDFLLGIGAVGDDPDRQLQQVQPRLGPSEQLDGQLQLGAEFAGRCFGSIARQVLLADVEPGQQRQGDRAPGLVIDEQAEDHEDVAVDVRRAGRSGSRVVMDAGTLDLRPVSLRRGVVQGEGEPTGPLEQGSITSRTSPVAMLSAFLPAAATAM